MHRATVDSNGRRSGLLSKKGGRVGPSKGRNLNFAPEFGH